MLSTAGCPRSASGSALVSSFERSSTASYGPVHALLEHDARTRQPSPPSASLWNV
jgi:hypothetical protein